MTVLLASRHTTEAPAPAALHPRLAGVRLDHLHSFLLLAEELHFGRAGRRLHVSVAGLSRRISQLERAVGHQLVHRRNGPLRLTEAGERLTVVARVILHEVRSLP